MFQRASVTSLGPGTKTPPKHTTCKEEEPFMIPRKTPPNRSRTGQHHHDRKTHESRSSPEANPTNGVRGLDQSHTPVRPVKSGQLGMNSIRGSTPPNPKLDLPNRSTDLCNTLGIVGTPHGESIAKLLSTKTRQNKRNRRNPAKSTENPKIKPLNPRIWEGNQRQKNHEGFTRISPIKSPRVRS
jgi:hypothetical protein